MNTTKCFHIVLSALSVVLAADAFAQKSSGTIRGEIINKAPSSVPINSQPSNAASIVSPTSNIAARSRNDVRFLLRPNNEAAIASQMNGVITDIKFNVGQRFKKGDVLVSLKCGVQNAQVAAQRARVREASLTYKSNQELLAGNAVSKFEVDISKAQVDQQNAVLRESSLVASLCLVKAPFSGGIVSVDVNEFETVSTGEALLEIIDDSSLNMSLNIPSTFINKVNKGDFFVVDVDETAKSYRAKVTGVSPAIDPVSKTIELRAVLVQKSAELRPGMSGSAQLNFSAQ